MPHGTLVYDGDCGFCAAAATWLARHGACEIQAWQALDLDSLDLTITDVTTAAYWLDEAGNVTYAGADAIAASLRASRHGWARLAGSAMASKPGQPVSGLVYRWVARNRFAIPGGDSCRLQDTRSAKQRWSIFGLFGLVFVLWAVGFGMKVNGPEPFPALIQPGFGNVPDRGGVVGASQVRYVVRFHNGREREIGYRRLFPEAGGMELSIGQHILVGGASRDPRTRVWLSERVARLQLGGKAKLLLVQRIPLLYDIDTRTSTEGEPRTIVIRLPPSP